MKFLPTTLIATLLCFSCAKTETTLKPAAPEPDPQPQIASNVRDRVKDLVAKADEYAANAAKLPGRNEADDRALVTQQFALLSQVLPMLNGPDMTGEFRQQFRIIESVRSQLAGGSQDLSAEPIIDTGLRAAHKALAAISARSFTDTPEAGKSLDAMQAKLNELDGAQGAIHRLVVAQAFNASATAASQMTNSLDARLNDQKPK